MIAVINNEYDARRWLEERAALCPPEARFRRAVELTLEELDKLEAVLSASKPPPPMSLPAVFTVTMPDEAVAVRVRVGHDEGYPAFFITKADAEYAPYAPMYGIRILPGELTFWAYNRSSTWTRIRPALFPDWARATVPEILRRLHNNTAIPESAP